MVKTTRQQRMAIARLWSRLEVRPTYRQFRMTVQPTFGCDGAVVVQFALMWVCIERDGYAHS